MISPQELKEFGTYGLVPKRGTINPEDVWQTARKKARRRHARPQNEFLVQARLCSLEENNGRKTRVHSIRSTKGMPKLQQILLVPASQPLAFRYGLSIKES